VTENEKLRALLAEARAITQDSLDSNTTGFEAENEVCKCNTCERYRSIIARIDAALAEPVEAMQAAEIDREHWTYKVLSQGLEIEAKKIREGMVRQAYQRGAEAMREAAADYIRRTGWDMNPQVSCSIRTLPIPEDKP